MLPSVSPKAMPKTNITVSCCFRVQFFEIYETEIVLVYLVKLCMMFLKAQFQVIISSWLKSLDALRDDFIRVEVKQITLSAIGLV